MILPIKSEYSEFVIAVMLHLLPMTPGEWVENDH